MHVLVFQVHGLSAVLPLCYLCNSEVICGIVHLQPAAPFRLSHAGPVAHREILFHLPPFVVSISSTFVPSWLLSQPFQGTAPGAQRGSPNPTGHCIASPNLHPATARAPAVRARVLRARR